jgi:lipoprotein-releasing system permease protein
MYTLFMAFRYLRAHKIIYFSMVGVALGMLAMVVVTSVMSGFSRDMRAKIRGMQSDIVVTSVEKNLWIQDYEGLCADLAKVPNVTAVSPRIEYVAWLGRGGRRTPIQIVGVDFERERRVSELPRFFAQGGKLDFSTKPDSGRETQFPGVVVGDQYYGGPRTGMITAKDAVVPMLLVKDFEITGTFKTGMVDYDNGYVFVELRDAQQFLKTAESGDQKATVNAIAVAVDDYARNGEEARKAVLDRIHERNPDSCSSPELHRGTPRSFGRCGLYRAMTWEQVKAPLLQAVNVEKGIQIIVMSLIIVVSGFNIIAIYTLVVRAKLRDIGILRALGASEGGVLAIFITSGGLCGLFGSIFGIILGLLLALNANEVEGFIRVVSRELNRLAYSTADGAVGYATAWATAGSLLLAGVAVVWTWTSFYRERQPTPWGRILLTLLALGHAAAWSTAWAPSYRPIGEASDPDLGGEFQFWAVAGAAAVWIVLMAAWRLLDRCRRHPSWIFFGFAGTIVFSALLLAVASTFSIALSIAMAQPASHWRGLELFPRNIYYLDQIPVFIDYPLLFGIVAMTLVVSLVFSIYPALRAARANPIEVIRDE